MRNRYPILFVLTVFAITLCILTQLSAQTAPPAKEPASPSPSKGTTIGTMVKDAITAALPGVSSIINLIWGTKPTENKKANDAQAALSTTTSQKALQASAQQQAKPLIQPATQIANELAVVEKFASASGQATQNLVRMQTLLTISPQPKNLLADLKEEWGLAADLLAPLFASGMEADIQKVREPAVQAMLLQIHSANTSVSGRIANRMKATKIEEVDLPALKDLVTALLGLLGGANTMAAAELNNLEQELSALAVWANSPAQGGGDLDKVVPDAKLLGFAGVEVKAAQEVAARIKE